MFKRILVPLDGSTADKKTLQVAARLAAIAHGSLVLTHIVTTGTHFSEKPAPCLETLKSTEKQKAIAHLIHMASSPIFNTIEVHIDVSWGEVAPSLIELARLHDCDLILLCRKQRQGQPCMLPGSVAERVVMHSSIPVLLVHENGPDPIFPCIKEGQTVQTLIGIDDIVQANTVIAYTLALLSSLVDAAHISIRLTHVVSSDAPDSAEREQGYHGCMQETMDTIKEYQRQHTRRREKIAEDIEEQFAHMTMSWSLAIGTDYAQALIKEAENGVQEESGETVPFHMLAISSLFGQQQQIARTDNSIVARITHETLLPVLIVPPQQREKMPLPSKTKKAQVMITA